MKQKMLAIDYGLKRVGLAITDELKIIATGLATVENKQLHSYLENLLKKENISHIVIGKPMHLSGEASGPEAEINALKKYLEEKYPDIEIHFYDERFTSKIAFQTMIDAGATKKQRQDKGLVDMISATIILRDFMERLKK